MAQRNPYFPTPPTAAWVRQPWSACLGFVTMMKYVAKTTVFIASNTLIGMRNLRARPSHGRRLPVQHYTACLGGTRSLWSARNFGCTREHARVSVVGGYRAAESGAGGTLGCSGSQTGESTTAAPAPVNAALSQERSDPTEQASRFSERATSQGRAPWGLGTASTLTAQSRESQRRRAFCPRCTTPTRRGSRRSACPPATRCSLSSVASVWSVRIACVRAHHEVRERGAAGDADAEEGVVRLGERLHVLLQPDQDRPQLEPARTRGEQASQVAQPEL